VLGDVPCVPPDAGHQRRSQRVEEEQPHEVQTGLGSHDAAVVNGSSVFVEDGKVDPREVRHEPGAPEDIGDLELASVLEHREAVSRPDRPGDAVDPGRRVILRSDPGERDAS
jgi:hypothetical protein